MFVQRYVEWAETVTDAPREFLTAGALACLSAALGRNVCINNRIFTNLWIVLMGESSVMRKSTAVALARTVCEAAGVSTFPDRITPESFYETLAANPQGLFALGELGGWLGSLARSYAMGLKQDMAELYDCPSEFRRIRKDAKGRVKQFKINRPYITILSASTTEWFEEHISETDAGGGFLPRFNYVIGTSREPYPIPPLLEIPDTLIDYLREVGKCTGNIVLDKNTPAYNAYVDWFNSFREKVKNAVKDLIPFAVRLETVALKISALAEAEKKPGSTLTSLSVDSILSGCSYADMFYDNARSVVEKLSYSSFERLCQRIYAFITRKPGCTQRDIFRVICVPRAVFQDAIDYLIESGRVTTRQPKGSRGRPTTYYHPVEEDFCQ